MIITNIRDFRDKATNYLKRDEPILVTRHGKVTGLFLPIEHPESIPLDLKKELLLRFGEYISSSLKSKGVKEEEILENFKAFKKSRRRR